MTSDVRALLQRAVALHQAGHLTDAAALYTQVLREAPGNADALNLLGLLSDAEGRREDAVALFDRAIASMPGLAEAHFNRANTLTALKRHDDALAAYERAIALRADYADAHLNAALLLRKRARSTEARAAFARMAIACPKDPRAPYGLAGEAAASGDFAAAIGHLRRALALRPDWPQALNDLGTYLNAAGATNEAITAFEQSAAAGGESYVTPRVNIGLARLSRGEFAAGWDGYALRNADPENPYRAPPVRWPWPQWQGEDLRGKTIFVWNDQGLGDAILYAGIVPEIIAVARACVIGCDPRLVPLFARSFPTARVIAYLPGAPAPDVEGCDVHSPLLDLGRWRRRALSDFPNRRGHLVADRDRTAHFRDELRAQAGAKPLLAGLSWRSANPLYGAAKSLRLADFAPHLQDERAAFFDLQYGDTRAEIGQLPRGAVLHTTSAFDRSADIDALAAYIAALDLVVTVSNTTAHLAGALGVPTWVLVPPARARLWYWFEEGAQSPWYASARIYRTRDSAYGWSDPLADVREGLTHLADAAKNDVGRPI